MTNSEIYAWLRWRREIGLPEVSEDVIQRVRSECIAIHAHPEPPIKIYTVKKYFWGLITIYKPLKIKNYDF